MAYATYENLVAAIDANLIADCCADTGGPLVGPNSVIDYALENASGRIQGVARAANMYTTANLDALSAANEPLLRSICVALAAASLMSRRGGGIPPQVEAMYKQALADLNELAGGRMIFGPVDAAADAGNPSSTAPGATSVTSVNCQLLASNTAFFGPFRPGFGCCNGRLWG